MARPEAIVETYLVEQVELHGGTCEKFVSPNRKNVPDRIVSWGHQTISIPDKFFGCVRREVWPKVDLVEVKAEGEPCSKGQLRDHKRRRAMGFRVEVIDTKAGVDAYIRSVCAAS